MFNIFNNRLMAVALTIALLSSLALALGCGGEKVDEELGDEIVEEATEEEVAPEGSYYTCPMHPDVKSDVMGKCPDCGMNLVLEEEVTDEDTVYACSMHPEEMGHGPGECSICGMDFEPIEEESAGEGE